MYRTVTNRKRKVVCAGQSNGSCDEPAALGAACVVVLGDVGHSPRMQYHALSFARHNYSVDFVGYGGSKPHDDVVKNPNIRLRRMLQPPKLFSALPRLLHYVLKTVWQILTLFLIMMLVRRPNVIILQTPPAIPSMLVCLVVAKLRCCRLVLDWHNYAYSIMALTHGDTSKLVWFSQRYEKTLGRFAKYHICVSNAMKRDLWTNWGIEAVPMYDRPPSIFRRLAAPEQHELFTKLATDIPQFTDGQGCSRFTELSESGEVRPRPRRPAIIVSSTSWTEDEDFSILLGALEDYDESSQLCNDLPKLVCVITGKGPLKAFYKRLMAEKKLVNVTIVTPWLLAEDYPKLLGSADVGVCLHSSSSGLDLPMKVVDMFGCQLPVLAIKYHCIHELVEHDVNGLIFRDVTELAQQLQDVLRGFPVNQDKLDQFRSNLKIYEKLRWNDAWDANVLPLLSS